MSRLYHTISQKQVQLQKVLKIIAYIIVCCFYSCSKSIPSTFEVVGMSLSNSNNSDQIPFDATTDSVPKNAYAIKLTLNEVMRMQTEGGDPLDNGFINEDRLISFQINSLNNFDATHPTGSSLNAYFLTQLSSSATIEAYVSKGNIGSGKYDGFNYMDNWSTQQYLYLMTPPGSAGNQSFIVEIGFSDGRTLSDTVNVILY
jgi:Domain of unknown function (DUF5034)